MSSALASNSTSSGGAALPPLPLGEGWGEGLRCLLRSSSLSPGSLSRSDVSPTGRGEQRGAMSPWIVSLGWVSRRIARRRLCLKKDGLVMPGIPHRLLNAKPRRLVAKAATQIGQHVSNLSIGHAVGKRWHDRTAFARHGANSRQDDVGRVARITRAERGAKCEIEP